MRASADEPAATGDVIVPEVAAWQQAANRGLAVDERSRGRGVACLPGQRPPEQRTFGAPFPGSVAPLGVDSTVSVGLPTQLRDELVDWLRGALPNEGCGLLVSDRVAAEGGAPSRFVGMRNAAASPYRYLMDPQEQLAVLLELDDADEVVWAIVHSHVASPAVPSATDIGLAAYPDALYVLCSFATEPPGLRAWTIVDGAVGEVAIESA